MSGLTGKVALVTGGSKGIGASIARHLGAAGATVLVNYSTSKSGADKTVLDIAAIGGKAAAIQADFSSPEEIARIFAEIAKTHGRLDILVNNAGVYSFGPLAQVTPEEFHRQFNLNVLGALLAIREAVSLFPSEGGTVINVGSTLGSMPTSSTSMYAATKGALDNITISLSKELGGRNIRVNSLNPGLIDTEGQQTLGTLTPAVVDLMSRTTPLGRVGIPDDVGPAAVFLASERARWITGQRLVVAGGRTQ